MRAADFLAEVRRLEAISQFSTGGVLFQCFQWRSLGGVECVNEKYGGINRFYGLYGILRILGLHTGCLVSVELRMKWNTEVFY